MARREEGDLGAANGSLGSMIGVEPPRWQGARRVHTPASDPRSNAASAGWIGAENDRLIHSRALKHVIKIQVKACVFITPTIVGSDDRGEIP
jgi:hypothetical protein